MRTHAIMLVRRVYIVLALLLLTGCPSSLSPASIDKRYEPRSCRVDKDCRGPSERTCQFERCVDGPADQTTTLSIVVDPPEDRDDLAPFIVRNIEWQTGKSQGSWQLQRARTVQGVLRQRHNPEPVRGVLFFEPLDGIAGRRFSKPAETDAKGNFALTLPAGAYSVTVRPDREEIPESMFHVVIEDETVPVNFMLPATQSHVRWSGRLVRLTENFQTAPLEGVTLWAVESGDGRQSTSAVTDANGHFSLYMHGDVKAFRLHVRSRSIVEGDTTLLVPTTTFAEYHVPDVVLPGANVELPGYDLIVGLISPAVHVKGSVRDGMSGADVPFAKIMATARPPALNEEFTLLPVERSTIEVRGHTNARGHFEMLLPGGYDYSFSAVDTTSGIALSPVAQVAVSALGAPPTDDISLVLQPPPQREIRLLESDGITPVGHYDVVAQLMTADALNLREYDLSSDQMAVAIHADADGLVRLPLMDGIWRFVLTARADYTLPRTEVYVDSKDMPSPTELTFDPGVTLAANVYDELSQPLRGATVQIWAEGDASSTRLVASGRSDAHGVVRIIMPWTGRIRSSK